MFDPMMFYASKGNRCLPSFVPSGYTHWSFNSPILLKSYRRHFWYCVCNTEVTEHSGRESHDIGGLRRFRDRGYVECLAIDSENCLFRAVS